MIVGSASEEKASTLSETFPDIPIVILIRCGGNGILLFYRLCPCVYDAANLGQAAEALSAEELIDQKTVEVKKHYKQVTDIQTAIDVQFGDKSPFHLKIKELQAAISDIPRANDESAQLKRKFDEAQKTLKTCANFRPRTGGFFIRLFLGQVVQAKTRARR